MYAVVGTVTEESNDYFATCYWDRKIVPVMIISLLVTALLGREISKWFPYSLPDAEKKVLIISLLITEPWKKSTLAIILLLLTLPTKM